MKKKYINTNTAVGMPAYLIKNGWAHDKASANKLLIFLAVLIVLATGIVYYLFVVRPAQTVRVNVPETLINKLSPEAQAKLRAAQR